MEKLSFNEQIEQSIKDNWDLDALSDYKGETFQYKDIARIIEKLHIIFEYSNVKPGDKIALCGRNSAHWGAVFFATLTYGAVAVPILHEFKADQVHNIVNHSEAKLLFVGDQVWKNLDANEMPNLEGIINIADYSLLVGRTQKVAYAREHLNQLFGERYPMNFRKHHISYYKGTGCHQLYFRHDKPFERRNDSLSRPLVQSGICQGSIKSAHENRRQRDFHVAHGSHVRDGF